VVKVSGKSFLTKVSISHESLEQLDKIVTTSMKYNNTYFNKYHDTKGTELIEDQVILEEKVGSYYR